MEAMMFEKQDNVKPLKTNLTELSSSKMPAQKNF